MCVCVCPEEPGWPPITPVEVLTLGQNSRPRRPLRFSFSFFSGSNLLFSLYILSVFPLNCTSSLCITSAQFSFLVWLTLSILFSKFAFPPSNQPLSFLLRVSMYYSPCTRIWKTCCLYWNMIKNKLVLYSVFCTCVFSHYLAVRITRIYVIRINKCQGLLRTGNIKGAMLIRYFHNW